MDDAAAERLKQFLNLLFPDLNGEFIEVRLLGKDLPPLQKFYPGFARGERRKAAKSPCPA